MTVLPLLTASSAKCYRSCPRKYFFSYERLVRPIKTPEAIRDGHIGHSWLEAWWLAVLGNTHEDVRLGAALNLISFLDDPYEHAVHTALACGYHARWSDAGLRPLAVEKEFSVPLVNPETDCPSRTWAKGGKIDVLVRDHRDEVWVLDHKFTSSDFSPGSDYRTHLAVELQVDNYVSGARALGFEPRGWIHDVVRRPSIRPLRATALDARKYTKEKVDKNTGEVLEPSRLYAGQRAEDESPEEFLLRLSEAIASGPDSYYARFPVVRLADEEREAAFDMWQVGVQIRESRRAEAWPRNDASCFAYGRACAYLPVCSGQASLDDGTRYRRAERPHEELGHELEGNVGKAPE